MPYTVQQLFDDRESVLSPIGIERNASVQDALNLMLKKQYSQLPIVDKENRLIGENTAYMVTNESILRALSNLNVLAQNLKVSDAMVKIRPYRLDDELSDLLKDLTDTYAVPIIGDKRQLVGVVTSYDTTEYFRKRAQDMMDIERIEKKLKEYISIYFTNETGEVDHNALNMAIADGMPSNKKELRGPFQQALQNYLELQNDPQSYYSGKCAKIGGKEKRKKKSHDR
jgi:CBS domain-containing protein